MPRAEWNFVAKRPVVKIEFQIVATGQRTELTLLADTGAGESDSEFDLILSEHDCDRFDGVLTRSVELVGAYIGRFPVYMMVAWIPSIGFSDFVRVAGVATSPERHDGVACLPFFNQFTYGNFGRPDSFGLEFDPTVA